MKGTYLEITYRHGKPLAAYLYLHRRPGDVAARTEKLDGGLLLDFSKDDRPIGVEITAPGRTTLEALNRALESVHVAPLPSEDLAPLVGA